MKNCTDLHVNLGEDVLMSIIYYIQDSCHDFIDWMIIILDENH